MAWSYFGAGTAATGNNASSLAPAFPGSWVPGDVAFLQFQNYGGTNSRTPSTPSGWTPIPNGNGYWQNGTTSHGLWYRQLLSGDSAPTLSLSGTGATNDTQLARIFVFRSNEPGVGVTIDTVGTPSTNASADNIGPITGITPADNHSMLIVSAGKSNDFNGSATLTNFTLATAITESITGNDAGMALLYDLAQSGAATGNLTVTDDGGTASAGLGLGIVISVREVYNKPPKISEQPPNIIGLNSDHPLFPYLRAAHVFIPNLGTYNLMDGGAYFTSDATERVYGVRSGGQGIEADGSSSRYLRHNISSVNIANCWTGAVVVSDAWSTSASNCGMMANSSNASPARIGSTHGGAVGSSSGGPSIRGDFRRANAGTSIAMYTGIEPKYGEPFAIAAVEVAQADHRFYISGREYTDTTDLGASTTDFAFHNVAGYYNGTSLATQLDGVVLCSLLGISPVPTELLREWTANPWALFKQRKARAYLKPYVTPTSNGTLSKTLDAATLTSTGLIYLKGTLAKTLDGLSKTLTGAVLVKGTSSKTLDGISKNLAGAIQVKAALDEALATIALAATGTITEPPRYGTLTKTLDAVGFTSAGTIRVQAALAKVLDAAGLSSAAKVLVQAAVSKALDNATLVSASQVDVAGTLAKTLETLAASGAGKVQIKAALARELETIGLAAVVDVLLKATLTKTLADATLVSVGISSSIRSGSLTQTLDSIGAVIQGIQLNEGTLAVTLESIELTSVQYRRRRHSFTRDFTPSM